jgi:hypothetical protein
LDFWIVRAAWRAAKRPLGGGPDPAAEPPVCSPPAGPVPKVRLAAGLFLAGLFWLAIWGLVLRHRGGPGKVVFESAGFVAMEIAALILGLRAWRRPLGKAIVIGGGVLFIAVFGLGLMRLRQMELRLHKFAAEQAVDADAQPVDTAAQPADATPQPGDTAAPPAEGPMQPEDPQAQAAEAAARPAQPLPPLRGH